MQALCQINSNALKSLFNPLFSASCATFLPIWHTFCHIRVTFLLSNTHFRLIKVGCERLSALKPSSFLRNTPFSALLLNSTRLLPFVQYLLSSFCHSKKKRLPDIRRGDGSVIVYGITSRWKSPCRPALPYQPTSGRRCDVGDY